MKCPGYHQRKRKPRRPAWKEPKVILPDEIDRIRDEIAKEAARTRPVPRLDRDRLGTRAASFPVPRP